MTAMQEYTPEKIIHLLGGTVERYNFENGLGASVACHTGSYGGPEGLYEMMLTVNDELIGAPEGWLTAEDVHGFLSILESADPTQHLELSNMKQIES